MASLTSRWTLWNHPGHPDPRVSTSLVRQNRLPWRCSSCSFRSFIRFTCSEGC